MTVPGKSRVVGHPAVETQTTEPAIGEIEVDCKRPIALPPDDDHQSSGPGEFHPQALTDPDVSVSAAKSSSLALEERECQLQRRA